MRKLVLSLILASSISPRLCAQRQYDWEVPRYEVGAQFDFNYLNGVGEWGGGVGGRFNFNFDDHFALDAELTYRAHDLFPPTGLPPTPVIGQTSGLFGLRAGKHAGSYGFFGHVRGGFLHFGTADGLSLLSRRTFAAAEVGGTFESYRGPVILRLDVGEMVVPYGNATVSPVFPGLPSSSPPRPLGTQASPLVGLGFAIRF